MLIAAIAYLGLLFVACGALMITRPGAPPAPGARPQGWGRIAAVWAVATGLSVPLGMLLGYGASIISYIVLFLVFWTPLSAQEEWLMALGSAVAGNVAFVAVAAPAQLVVLGRYLRRAWPTLAIAGAGVIVTSAVSAAGGPHSADAQLSSLIAGQLFIAVALSLGTWAQLLWADRSAALARP